MPVAAERAYRTLTRLINWAESELDSDTTDRQYLIEDLLDRLRLLQADLRPEHPHV